MLQTLRPRLRALVATAICALVVAPALVTATTTTSGAAPPGINSATLTVGGQGSGNPWTFYGGYYNNLQAALQSSTTFGPNGVMKKGSFTVAPSPLAGALSFPGTLSGLDVFFAGLPTSEYSPAEQQALRDFNADGRALVLNANTNGFGDVASFLGFTMRSQRAFFGTDAGCGWTNTGSGLGGGESAPSTSNAVGSHPIHSGPFDTAPAVPNFHTVQVFTGLPAQAQAIYNLNVSGQAPQFALTGPVGSVPGGISAAYVQAPFTITTAALTPFTGGGAETITSVDFYDGVESVPTALGSDSDFPFSLSNVVLSEGTHTILAIARLAGGGTLSDTLGVLYDADANAVPSPQPTNFTVDCPGGGSEVVNNNISGTTAAVIPKGALSANSGPIVITSDLDMMSNFGNWFAVDQFALNAFAWVMDEMLPDVPDDTFFPLQNPVRVYDTRTPVPVPLTHTETRNVQVAGVGGVPADAKAIIANVTVADPTSSGYLTVFPTGQPQPITSTHNFDVGEAFANMITMQVGAGGYISVFDYLNAGGGSVNLIVDIVGYTRRDNSGTRLRTISPGRLLDTRNNIGLSGAFGPKSVRNLTVRGGGTGVPNDAESVVLNMTVTNATTTGYVTVWPAGQDQPNVSNLNNVIAIARPNLVVARIGTGGQVSIANEFGNADIIADVVGYFSPGAFGSGGVMTGLQPSRILDTRPSNPFAPTETRNYTVLGAGSIPITAKTAILKVTAVDPTGGGYVTVFPTGTANPPNSNLNFSPNMTIPNLVVTQIGSGGQISVFNSVGTTTHILIDVLGYAD